jgi:hypothetical protein
LVPQIGIAETSHHDAVIPLLPQTDRSLFGVGRD